MAAKSVDRAIACVADRTPTDWEALSRDTVAADERDWLDCLQVLEAIAAFHETRPLPPVSVPVESTAPPTWGKYKLLEQVGEGGFASVHRAWDSELERQLAVKILHRRIPDDVSRERLLREGRALARIRHPHVVRVLGVEAHEDQIALCMEFVHGETLDQVVRNHGPMSAREAALIGGDLCRALAAVHASGFVHRDVKARNVIRETGGRVVLMDFGATAGNGVNSGADVHMIGTPIYLAPEWFGGVRLGPPADIYSLGVLLFYLVSGEFPVNGTSVPDLRTAHSEGRRKRLQDLRPELPAAFVHLVEQATATAPEDRPASAGELESLLARFVESTTTAVHGTQPPPGSLAVLPFVDASSGGTLQYFCEGIADELSNALTSVAGLRVVARGSTFRFRGASDDVRHVGALLNVSTVLEGSVRAVGNQLRVVSRLVDASDGVQIWSERFDRRLDDVFAVQDDIAAAVVKALRVHADRVADSGRTLPGTPGTRDFEAYTLYLKGRHHWNKRTEASLHRSVAYFQSAVGRDESYAEAHAGLAAAQATLGLYGAVAPGIAFPEAKAAALRAIDLQPSLSSAWGTLACVVGVHEWSWAEAERHYQKAIELNATDSNVQHWYAINHLVPLGRFEEAAEALKRASEADPLSVPVNVSAGLLAYFARRYDEARERFREGLELDPYAAMARLFLGLTLAEIGRLPEAVRELEETVSLTLSPETQAAVAYAYAKAGQRDRALEGIAELGRQSSARYVSPSLIAQIHVALGNTTAALESLQHAIDVRAADLAWLRVRPVFDSLRDDARFEALVSKLGQPNP